MAGASPQSLVQLLRAVAGAKKGIRLYPPGSTGVGTAIGRLRSVLDRLANDGLVLRVRLTRDGFAWVDAEGAVSDEVLAGLRRDLQARGIGEFHIEPEVQPEELVAFLDLLNLPPEAVPSLNDATAFLRARRVTNILISGLSASGAVEDDMAGFATGGATPGDEAGVMSFGPGAVPEDLVVAIVERVEQRLAVLAYDREALGAWLEAIASTRGVQTVSEALRMLSDMAVSAGDRDVRTRTALEAALRLPEATLRALLSDCLLPRAGTDLTAFNLLVHMSEDDLATVSRLVPADQLMRLTAELLEFPWEEGKRQRLVEAMTWRLSKPAGAEDRATEAAPAMDEALLAELRQEIVDALNPDTLLERSAEILLALHGDAHIAPQLGAAADALAEVVVEALTRGRLDVATRVLEEIEGVGAPTGASATIRAKAGDRAQVAQLVALLRQDLLPGREDAVARYLGLVGPASVQTFIDLQAEEADRRVRLHMSDVLARLGAVAVPVLATRLDDPHWQVARNALYALGRMGPAAAAAPIASAFAHPHPRVRREAIRAATAVGGPVAADALGALMADPDPDVRRAAISALGAPGHAAATPILRQALTLRPRGGADDDMAREIMLALMSIGTPEAVGVVRELAERRARFWERAERRLRDMAVEVLAGPGPAGPEAGRG